MTASRPSDIVHGVHVSDDPSGGGNPPLWIKLLGAFQVAVDDRVLDAAAWRLRKAKTLVKLLALAPHQALHRDELLDLLWPDLDPDAATNNLRYALHIARRVLEPAADEQRRFLRWNGEQLLLAPGTAVWIDVVAFESAAATARRSRDPSALQQALDVYAGELLPEDRYEDWAAGRRETLRETYLTLLLQLAQLHEAGRDYRQAIEVLRHALTIEPALEDAHVVLMRVFALIGQRRLALRQYEQVRDILRDELDAEPEAATQRLYDAILSGRFPTSVTPDVDSPPAPAAAGRHNLPTALTSFVGRGGELEEVRGLLATTRLVTLTGVGGAGKSRLAAEAARGVVDDYRDGIWLVELAALADGALVAQTTARVLGIQQSTERPIDETLAGALRDRQLLLVLDNCEHLIDACADLALALLTNCPQVRLLATSRAPLGLPGEVVRPLRPLSLPPDRGIPSAVLDADAGRLFVERVRYRDSAFDLTPEHAPAVAEICRRLEGLPLAIELAAARITVLSPAEIAARLDDALGLLSGGGKLVPDRHRSLRGVLDWSYDLLSEPEQTLLARLAVFTGGWILEAAEAVAVEFTTGHDVRCPTDVLDLLSSLVDKSLVIVIDAGEDRTTRYSLLEPVRQYARERLRDRGEVERLGESHARYFLTLAETAAPELQGGRQGEWLGRLEREHDNLRAALRWAVERGQVDVEARLCAARWRFWYVRGHLIEGERWLAGALSRTEGDVVSPLIMGQLLQGAGAVAWNRADFARTEELNHRALALFERAGDRNRVAAIQHNLGVVAEMRGDYTEATRRYADSLRLREELNDTWGVATTLHALGVVARQQGDLERATTLFERSLALQREIGNTRGVGLAMHDLAVLAFDRGDYARAERLAVETLANYQDVGDTALCSIGHNTVGYVIMYQGDRRRALAEQAEALRLAQETGYAYGLAHALEGMAAAVALGPGGFRDVEQAARLYGAADALRSSVGLPLPPADRALYERSLATARASLDEDAFATAWAAGQALSLDEAIAEALAASESPAAPEQSSEPVPASSPLSTREREVARLVARGLTNRQIADELRIANRTVDSHVGNILRKLALSSRADVNAWVSEHGLNGDDAARPGPSRC